METKMSMLFYAFIFWHSMIYLTHFVIIFINLMILYVHTVCATICFTHIIDRDFLYYCKKFSMLFLIFSSPSILRSQLLLVKLPNNVILCVIMHCFHRYTYKHTISHSEQRWHTFPGAHLIFHNLCLYEPTPTSFSIYCCCSHSFSTQYTIVKHSAETGPYLGPKGCHHYCRWFLCISSLVFQVSIPLS